MVDIRGQNDNDFGVFEDYFFSLGNKPSPMNIMPNIYTASPGDQVV